MAKHRLEDKLAPNQEQPPAQTQAQPQMQSRPQMQPQMQTQRHTQAQHQPKHQPQPQTQAQPQPQAQSQTRSGFWNLLRRREDDNLYERSFRFCTRCGNEVYVLADGCRTCGETRSLTPEPAL